MKHEDLIRRLHTAAAEHGTVDGAPPDRSELLAEAAAALEAHVPLNNDDALAYQLPELVAAQFIHVMTHMPYGFGLSLPPADQATVGEVVGWFGQLLGRLAEHTGRDDERDTELAILLHQRKTIRHFLGLDQLRLHPDIAPEEQR